MKHIVRRREKRQRRRDALPINQFRVKHDRIVREFVEKTRADMEAYAWAVPDRLTMANGSSIAFDPNAEGRLHSEQTDCLFYL